MENKVSAVRIEWYRVRLAGDPILSEARNPGSKNNSMFFFDSDDGTYTIQDIYPDGRYTIVQFNKDHVMEFIYKTASENENGQ